MLDRPKLGPRQESTTDGVKGPAIRQSGSPLQEQVELASKECRRKHLVFLHRRELHQHGFVAACCLNTFNLAKPIAQNTQYWNAIVIHCGFYDKCKMQTGGLDKSFQSFVFRLTLSYLIFQFRNCPKEKYLRLVAFERMCTTCLLIQCVHH